MKRKGRSRVPRFVKALTRCTRCRTIFERDFNGARNIRRCALHIRGGRGGRVPTAQLSAAGYAHSRGAA
ncbi:hypothetical protein T492DRAFT_894047 [Pavlovales sp. CCMP2436]|nr:hypothetical protein T492DRAFT_894047 [Pavlovales sp. CCMP2436]